LVNVWITLEAYLPKGKEEKNEFNIISAVNEKET